MSQMAVDDIQTMRVEIDVPREAIIREFLTEQRARSAEGLPWLTLREWTATKFLDAVMIDHQKRVFGRGRRTA